MSKLNQENTEFTQLRQILADEYRYAPEHFHNRTTTLHLPEARPTPNALCFEAHKGAPFLLAVTIPSDQKDVSRSAAIAHALNSPTIDKIALFDSTTKSFEILRRRYSDNEFETIPTLEPYKLNSVQPDLFHDSTDRTPESLLPLTSELEDIFFEIHSIMRDIDGLHSNDALEELCKLLFLKTYTETYPSTSTAPTLRSLRLHTVDESAASIRGNFHAAISNACDQRVQGVIGKPFLLSNAALVRSYAYLESIDLSRSDTDIKGRAFQKVMSRAARAGMGQYFTPAQVCSLMVAITDPRQGDRIIDPFCGSAHFLSEAVTYIRQRNANQSADGCRLDAVGLFGIEKSARMTRVALTDMALKGLNVNLVQQDALLDFENYLEVAPEGFDVVLTNPPFGSILGEEAFAALAKFELARGRRRVPLEVVGLERSVQLLRPGGKLAIVLPEGIFAAASFSYVRDWLVAVLAPRVIIDLPPHTFSPFGANVRSGILFGAKRLPDEVPDPDDSVCMIRIDNIGFDAAGRHKEGCEHDEVVAVARTYFGAEGCWS